jgi:hypothetical protein
VAGPPAVSILLSAPAVGPLLARLRHLHAQPGEWFSRAGWVLAGCASGSARDAAA